MLAGLTGGGAMLAGAMLLACAADGSPVPGPAPGAHHRHPRAAARTRGEDPHRGRRPSASTSIMDEVLRRLAAATAGRPRPCRSWRPSSWPSDASDPAPVDPADTGPALAGHPDQLHWTLPAATDLRRRRAAHPRPARARTRCWSPSVPATTATVWLLNIEDLDLSITGDATSGATSPGTWPPRSPATRGRTGSASTWSASRRGRGHEHRPDPRPHRR